MKDKAKGGNPSNKLLLGKKISKGNTFGNFANQQIFDQKSNKGNQQDLLIAASNKQGQGNHFKDARLTRQLKETNIGNVANLKKSQFDLDSEDEQPLKLTHKGRALNDLKDDFQEEIDRDSDIEVPAELVNKLHFEGFDDPNSVKNKINNLTSSNVNDQGKRKTKQEIYDEIIKKSKFLQYERQKQKDDDITKFKEFNDNFNDLGDLLVYRKQQDQLRDSNKNYDEYDQLTKELATQSRARANLEADNALNEEQARERKKQKNQVNFSKTGVMSSDEDDYANDDEMDTNIQKQQRPHEKQYQQIEKINQFMDMLKNVKKGDKKQTSNRNGDEDEDESDIDSMDDIDLDDEDEEEGDQMDGEEDSISSQGLDDDNGVELGDEQDDGQEDDEEGQEDDQDQVSVEPGSSEFDFGQDD